MVSTGLHHTLDEVTATVLNDVVAALNVRAQRVGQRTYSMLIVFFGGLLRYRLAARCLDRWSTLPTLFAKTLLN
jgi:hypothetical protein